MRTAENIRGMRALRAAASVLAVAGIAAWVPAAAQDSAPAPGTSAFLASASLVPASGFREPGDPNLLIHGISHSIAPRWKASYGLGLAEETELTASWLRHDQTLAYGTRSDRASRDNWRHFLGVEYTPLSGLSFLGGIAKASGVNGYKGGSFSPTGYERLRLNAGAHWALAQSWAVDGSFSFIPNGAARFPGDAGYIPGLGDADPTFFVGLTVSRRF